MSSANASKSLALSGTHAWLLRLGTRTGCRRLSRRRHPCADQLPCCARASAFTGPDSRRPSLPFDRGTAPTPGPDSPVAATRARSDRAGLTGEGLRAEPVVAVRRHRAARLPRAPQNRGRGSELEAALWSLQLGWWPLAAVRDDRPKPASEARWRRSGRSRGWASLSFDGFLGSETRVPIPKVIDSVTRA